MGVGRTGRALAVALVVILIACSSGLHAFAYNPNPAVLERALARGTDYLAAGYDPHVGLIPETPHSTTYWLLSDNFLAARALSEYSQDNATLLSLAANLSSSIVRDSSSVGMDNQYTTLGAGPCQIHDSKNYDLYERAGDWIKTTLNNGSATFSPSAYADIAFLEAVCLDHEGRQQALAMYLMGAAMFDGVGFKDVPYSHTCDKGECQYQTYKLALYIIASIQLGRPVAASALWNLIAMQSPNGGFRTGYDRALSPMETLTNTETTSLALLAIGAYLDAYQGVQHERSAFSTAFPPVYMGGIVTQRVLLGL
jgi:hypothetical protein